MIKQSGLSWKRYLCEGPARHRPATPSCRTMERRTAPAPAPRAAGAVAVAAAAPAPAPEDDAAALSAINRVLISSVGFRSAAAKSLT